MKIEVTEIELHQLINGLKAHVRGIEYMLRWWYFFNSHPISHIHWRGIIQEKEELIEKLRKYKRK